MSKYDTSTAEALLRKSRTKLLALAEDEKQINPAFDSYDWTQSFEEFMEPTHAALLELSQEFAQVTEELLTAQGERFLYLEKRKEGIGRQMKVLNDCYISAQMFVESMCTSLYIEFKRLESDKNQQIEEWYNAYRLMAEQALNTTDRIISLNNKQA